MTVRFGEVNKCFKSKFKNGATLILQAKITIIPYMVTQISFYTVTRIGERVIYLAAIYITFH